MAGSALSEGHPLRGTCKVAHYSDDVKAEDEMRTHPEDFTCERAGDAAVKGEREACARIADDCAAEMRSQYYRDFWPVYWYMMMVAERIAGEIRKARG